MQNSIKQTLQSIPESLKSGCRCIFLIHRKKDGGKDKSSIKVFSRNSLDFEKQVDLLHDMQKTTHKNHRIYASINSRNPRKFIYEFKKRQLEIDTHFELKITDFYLDIHGRLISCAMDPGSRETSNFLIDCDSEDERELVLEKIPEDLIIHIQKTPNGWHIVTKPFNPNEIKVEVKKDALMFIC